MTKTNSLKKCDIAKIENSINNFASIFFMNTKKYSHIREYLTNHDDMDISKFNVNNVNHVIWNYVVRHIIADNENDLHILGSLLRNKEKCRDISVDPKHLVKAVSNGNIMYVKCLLENGVNPNIPYGKEYAISRINSETTIDVTTMFKLLLKAGAKIVNDDGSCKVFKNIARNINGDSVLEILPMVLKHYNLDKDIKKNHISTFLKNYDLKTIMKIIDMMTGKGIPIDTEAISSLLENDDDDCDHILKKLLKLGADPNGGLIHPLYYTAVSANVKQAKLLIEYGSDINHIYFENDNLIHVALVEQHDKDINKYVKFCVDNGVDINQCNKLRVTPLMIACANSKVKIAELFINCGAIVDYDTINTIMSLSNYSLKKMKLIDLLIEKHVSFKISDSNGITPLMVVCDTKRPNILILKKIIPLSDVTATDVDGWNALHYMAKFETNTETENGSSSEYDYFKSEDSEEPFGVNYGDMCTGIKLLLDAGIDIDSKTNAGSTALSFVTRHTSESTLINCLLEKDADVNAVDNDGKNILQQMLVDDECLISLDTIKLLIENGISLSHQDALGWTVILYVINRYSWTNFPCEQNLFYKKNEAILKILLNGKNVNKCSNDNISPLNLAVSQEYDTIRAIKILIKHGANIDHADNYGLTPLLKALSCSGDVDIVKLLIDNNANIDLVDKKGNTGLMYCYERIDNITLELVSLVIDAGVNINAINKNGYTALMFACQKINDNSQLLFIEHLLDAGAKINIRDIKKRKALYYFNENKLIEKDEEYENIKKKLSPE